MNSLKNMENDLRTIAKRYKFIKFTTGLAIIFLMLGVNALSEEVDSIVESKEKLKISTERIQTKINTLKTENEKKIGGAKLKLVKLMEQGDHVVKSPWSSWQFGMNYTYNNWGGSHKGRKDKKEKYPYEGIFVRENGKDEINRYISPKSQYYQDISKQYSQSQDLASASSMKRTKGSNNYGLAITGPEIDYPVPIELSAGVRPRNINKNPTVVVAPQVITPNIPEVKSFSSPRPIINRIDLPEIKVDLITSLHGGNKNEAFILNSKKFFYGDRDAHLSVIASSDGGAYRELAPISQTSAVGGTINVHSKGKSFDIWTEGVKFIGVKDGRHYGKTHHHIAYIYTGDISKEQGKDYGQHHGYAQYAAMRTASGQRMDIKDVTINYSGKERVDYDPATNHYTHFRRFLFWLNSADAYADSSIKISEDSKINIDGNRLVMLGMLGAAGATNYNVGLYNQGKITTSSTGKNNYILSAAFYYVGGSAERVFFVNGDKGKISLNGEKDAFASLQITGVGANTIINNGEIVFNAKEQKGIISGINLREHNTSSVYRNVASEILLYKPMIFNGDNSIGLAYFNRSNPYFEGGHEMPNVVDDNSIGYDGTPNSVVKFTDKNKTSPSIIKFRLNGNNSTGMFFNPYYDAEKTPPVYFNPGKTSPNAPAGEKGLVDIISKGNNNQLVYIKRGIVNIGNTDSNLIADGTKKNTGIYVNGEYYDSEVVSSNYTYDRNVSRVTNEAKISLKDSEDSSGIFVVGKLKNFDSVTNKVIPIRDYVNNTRAKMENTGEITITGKGVKGIISDNGIVKNSGKIILDGVQKNDKEGSVGLAAIDGGFLESTGIGSEIKVSGKSSIGLYTTKDHTFTNIGVDNTKLIVENTKVEANDGAVNVYSNGGTINLGTAGSSSPTVELVTGKNALTFNNAFFYTDNAGNIQYDPSKNGKINLLGKVKVDVKAGGTAFYIRGNGGAPLYNTLNIDAFNNTLGNLTLNMDSKATLVSASNVTANLSSVLGNPNFGGAQQPTITGSPIYKILKLHRSKFNVDTNVNLDNPSDPYNRMDVANSSVDIKSGVSITGSKLGQNIIAQENDSTNNVNAIKLINQGNIDLLGENSSAIYGKFSEITNIGNINLGEKSTALFGKNDSLIKNTGTISLGNNSTAIFATEGRNHEVINTGAINGTGKKAVAIVYDGIGTGTRRINNASKINLLGESSVAIYAKGNNYSAENNGSIEVGNAPSLNNPSVGMFTTVDSISLKNNANIKAGDNSVGIYGVNNISSAGNITTGNGSVGIYSKGSGVSVGNISVGNNQSTGVYLENGGGTVISNGNMTIGEESYGIVSNEGSHNFDFTSSNTSNVSLKNKGIYIYSSSKNGTVVSNANVVGTGNENYGLYTAGKDVTNNGNINLGAGIGNVGMYSVKGGSSRNGASGIITVGVSDITPQKIEDRRYALGMAAGYRKEDTGNIINEGVINVNGANSIGMYATGKNSTAVNKGTINLGGKGSVGMLLDEGARGKNEGIIQTTAGMDPNELEGVVGLYAGRNSVLENTGTIHIVAKEGAGYFQARGGMIINRGTIILGQNGAAENGEEIAGGPGSNTTKNLGNVRIKAPKGSPTAKIYINGVEVPSVPITITEGKRDSILHSPIGMYIDTLRKTNPIIGLDNIVASADLIIGSEAASKTNSKSIEVSGKLLEPYNKTIEESSVKNWNIYSGALTWTATATLGGTSGTINKLYMAKRAYSSFAKDKNTTKNTYNFAEGLEERYSMNSLDSREKILFNKLNSIGNNEEILLYQAFDEMMGHQYANVQQRIFETGKILDKEFRHLKKDLATKSKDSNKFKVFGMRGEYKTDTAGVIDYTSHAEGFAYVHDKETVKMGATTGWYTGFVHNNFKFKDIGKSKEDMYQLKTGLFKSVPFDDDNSLNWTISGEAFVGYNKTQRKFLVVDEVFNARSNYWSYGIALNNELSKTFRTSEDTFIRPYGGLKLEYGRFQKIKEKSGEVKLEVKANDYYSIKPEIGTEFGYKHLLKNRKTLTASLGVAYENELGKVANAKNKARVAGTKADWFNIRGEKEDRRGNIKTDLRVGLENEKYGITANVGYDTKGNNVRGGLGLRIIF